MMSSHLVTRIAFRGDRDYITGVDLLENAISLIQSARPDAEVTNIRLSCYRMLHQSDLAATISSDPVPSKDYDTVVQVDADATTLFLGWRASAETGPEERVPCNENDQLAFVDVAEWSAEVKAPIGIDGSLLAMLVASIKAASIRSFPELEGRWVFAGANLSSIPKSWSYAKVVTQTRIRSPFYKWNVEVDGSDLGSIMFFLHS